MVDETMDIEVIFENDELVAINKPHGLLVHRSKMAADAQVFALQLLRDKINQKVYPAHRLDRKTSGVLLFTKSKIANIEIQKLFMKREVTKNYLALVRGFVEPEGIIDYPLKDGSKLKEASTAYRLLKKFELPIPSEKFNTSRYSLVELNPTTGRTHQIRRHLAHILHPIIGDRPHGCNKQNRIWKNKFGMTNMLLHAQKLEFSYPVHNEVKIEATPSKVFQGACKILEDGNMLNRV